MRIRSRRPRSLFAMFVAMACFAVATGSAVPGAQGAVDSTGPSLTVPARSAYVIGQITDDPFFVDGELWFADRGAYRQFTWKASDPSGICRYTVDEFHNVEGWYDETESYTTHCDDRHVHLQERRLRELRRHGAGPRQRLRLRRQPHLGDSTDELHPHRTRLRAHRAGRVGAHFVRMRDRRQHAAHVHEERIAEHRCQRAGSQGARRPGDGQGAGSAARPRSTSTASSPRPSTPTRRRTPTAS